MPSTWKYLTIGLLWIRNNGKNSTSRNAATGGWPKRGEIYLAALDRAIGHEIKKTRPALVIQNDISNRYSAITMVAPITSTVRLPLSPLHVLLPADVSTVSQSFPSRYSTRFEPWTGAG